MVLSKVSRGARGYVPRAPVWHRRGWSSQRTYCVCVHWPGGKRDPDKTLPRGSGRAGDDPTLGGKSAGEKRVPELGQGLRDFQGHRRAELGLGFWALSSKSPQKVRVRVPAI